MSADAHYFGLGDKTGPLDRRGEAFALWNSDAGGFGESTDPLYLRQAVRCQVDAGVITVEFDRREGSYPPWWRQIELEVHGMASAPRRVRLGNMTLLSGYDPTRQTLHVNLPDLGAGGRLRIEVVP